MYTYVQCIYIYIYIYTHSHTLICQLAEVLFEMYLQKVGWGGMDWIDLSQDRSMWRALVNPVMNLWVS